MDFINESKAPRCISVTEEPTGECKVEPMVSAETTGESVVETMGMGLEMTTRGSVIEEPMGRGVECLAPAPEPERKLRVYLAVVANDVVESLQAWNGGELAENNGCSDLEGGCDFL